MHHIAGSIEEWVQEEEAKYQADILAKEVERHAKEIAEKEAAAEREAAATRESQIYTIILFFRNFAGSKSRRQELHECSRVREINSVFLPLLSRQER